MEEKGIHIEVYPLLREKTRVMHPEAEKFVARAHFMPFISLDIVKANLFFLRTKPGCYFAALYALLRHTIGSRRYFVGALGLFPKSVYFAHKMLKERITHIHAHFASHPAAAAFVIRRLVDIPFSFTAHGSDLHRDQHMLKQKIQESRFVATISEFNRQVILKKCTQSVDEKVKIVHCGVDTTYFKPRKNNPDGSTSDQVAIFCIGTLHEVKGQSYLIEACKILKREDNLRVECHFVGDGPDKSRLLAETRVANLLNDITFHGRKTRSEITRLLDNADIAVAPSVPTRNGRKEGIPVALMEAMACGIPVVASDLSGIPELVISGDNGFLVPPRDAEKLASALKILITDPSLRSRFGERARLKIMEEFDLNTNTELLLNSICGNYDKSN